MKVKELFSREKKFFSFEFFPPKTQKGRENLFRAFEELREISPDFVSVTYGALGTTQEKSLETLDEIYKIHGRHAFAIMAHYTCIGASKEKVDSFLSEIHRLGVENILALRGDPPEGMEIDEVLRNSPFPHAVDLVRYIKKKTDKFCIGVAGYPEGHSECPSRQTDLEFLKLKVNAGADFIITQLFFNNKDFFDFERQARDMGIQVPIIPGIMPIENFNQIIKITSMCGAKIPDEIRNIFQDSKATDNDKRQRGIEYTVKQCKELLANGVPGIHFYTLNKSSATREIFRNLGVKRV